MLSAGEHLVTTHSVPPDTPCQASRCMPPPTSNLSRMEPCCVVIPLAWTQAESLSAVKDKLNAMDVPFVVESVEEGGVEVTQVIIPRKGLLIVIRSRNASVLRCGPSMLMRMSSARRCSFWILRAT